MFAFSPPPVVGLDISSSSIKLVELSRQKGRYRVERFGIEPLHQNELKTGAAPDMNALASAASTLHKRTHSRSRLAVTALSSTDAIIKIITLPAGMSEEDLETQIQLEGGQYIPFSMDAVSFDFAVLGPDETRPGYEQVLLVASKREAVEDRVAALSLASLETKVVDVEPFALLAVHEYLATQPGSPAPGQTVALIDIGASTTKVHVFQQGQPVYNRDHGFGGDRLTEDIMRRYGLEHVDAGRMKRRGGLPADYERDVLYPFVNNLALDILRSLEFFQSSMPSIHIDKAVLFGGCAMTPGLLEALRNRSALRVSIADPFAGMDLAPGVDASLLRAESASLGLACGLAMRRFA